MTKCYISGAKHIKTLHIAKIAQAMGLHAEVVDKPGQIQNALRNALRHGGPAVIEVIVDESISPPLGDRARSISGFVERKIHPADIVQCR